MNGSFIDNVIFSRKEWKNGWKFQGILYSGILYSILIQISDVDWDLFEERIHLTFSSKDKKFNKEHSGKTSSLEDYSFDIQVKTADVQADKVVIHNVRRKSFEIGRVERFYDWSI